MSCHSRSSSIGLPIRSPSTPPASFRRTALSSYSRRESSSEWSLPPALCSHCWARSATVRTVSSGLP
jgi:hypothetical protein